MNRKFLFPLVFFFSLFLFGLFAYRNPGVDFRGYYGAALLVRRGGNPYDYAQLAPILEEISGFQGNNPYFYPPWYCLAFTPLTFLSFRTAQILWIGINLLLFTLALEWLWETLEWDIEPWFRWLLFTFANIFFGYAALVSENSGFVLLFALALTLRGMKRNQPILAGLGLVLMGTKPQALGVAILVLGIWAWKHQRKTVYWAFGWFVSFLGAATLFFPRWWDFDKTNFGIGISYYQDQAGIVTGKRVAATVYDWGRYFWGLNKAGIVVLFLLAFTLGVWLLARTWKQFPSPYTFAIAGTLFTLLITPYALQYDFVPLSAALFWIAKHFSTLQPRKQKIILLMLSFAMLIPFFSTLQYQIYWVPVCFSLTYGTVLSQIHT